MIQIVVGCIALCISERSRSYLAGKPEWSQRGFREGITTDQAILDIWEFAQNAFDH